MQRVMLMSRNHRVLLLRLAPVFACGVSLAGCGKPTEAELYPGPWTPIPSVVSRAMALNNVGDCAHGMARVGAGTEGMYREYLVFCGSNSTGWVARVVAPAINKVSPPGPPLKAIPPPV